MEKSGVLIADLHLQWLNLILEWMSLFEIVFISNILNWAGLSKGVIVKFFQVASKNVVLFGTVKIDTQDLSSVTFSQLLTMDPPFQIVGLDFDHARQQSVVQCRAVVSHNNELIHAGDYVKFYAPVNELRTGMDLV
ncbi:hypothetical protein EMCRGX_G033858 [Ephydatia muelleri]